MNVRFTTCVVGAHWAYDVGDVVDLPAADAVRYLNAGYAEPVKGSESIETATATLQIETVTVPAAGLETADQTPTVTKRTRKVK